MDQIAFPLPKKDCNLQFACYNLQFAIYLFFQTFILFNVLYSGNSAMAQTQGGWEIISPIEKTDRPQSRAGQGGAEVGEQLNGELGAASVKEDDNPLINIGQSMIQVGRRMIQTDAGPATLALQKQIIADLDRLIDQVRKSAGPGSASASNKDSSSAQDSSDSARYKPGMDDAQKLGANPATRNSAQVPVNSPTRKNDAQEMRTMIKDLWGELPGHVRGQVLQMPIEEFVPEYQELIEDYFRDLANERIGDRKQGTGARVKDK